MQAFYKNYLKETENKNYYETEYGFFVWKIFKEQKELYIAELYLDPEYRKSIYGYKFVEIAKEIAKNNDCLIVTSRVLITNLNCTESVLWNIRCGFQIAALNGNEIWFKYIV